MKTRIFLSLFLLFQLIAASAAAERIRLSPDRGLYLHIPGQKEPILFPRSGDGVAVTWNPQESKYISLSFPEKRKLPEFTRLSVTARFRVPADTPVRKVSLRLLDSGNENFQFSRPAVVRDGLIETVWEIPAGSQPHGWGGDGNKMLDQPARVYGFSIDHARQENRTSLELLSVEIGVAGGGTVSAERPFHTFNSDEIHRRRSGTGELHPGSEALLITGIVGECFVTERCNPVRTFHAKPRKLKVTAELLAGNPRLRWSFRDAGNRLLKTPALPLKPGKNTLEFDLDSLFAGARLPFRAEGFTLSCDGDTPGAVLLTGATLVTAELPSEALDLEIVTGNALHVLKRGEENAFKLNFTNRSNRGGEFTADLEFRDFFGNSFRERATFQLEAGETAGHTPRRLPGSFGHWEVAADITEHGAPEFRSRKTGNFAYLDPAGPTPGRAPGFLFGICNNSASWSPGEQQKGIEAAALCGAKIVRNTFEWQRLQPAPDRWNFAPVDSLIDRHLAAGIELQGFFGFTPRWAAPPERRNASDWKSWNRGAPDPGAWRNYVRTVLSRYRGKIRYWEVWNEPDLSGFNRMSLEEYAALLKTAGEIARQNAPEAVVMTGGFATATGHTGLKSPTFQRDCLKLARGAFQLHAYHQHGSFDRFRNAVDGKFLPMRRETGTDVPWYANETAVSSMNGTERNQALTLFKKLIFSWARGAVGYNWYNLRNDGFDPMNAEHNYGMMSFDFQPKPVYSVFNMLAGTFREARFLRPLETGDDFPAFVFADGKNLLIPAWNESGSGSTLSVVLRTDAAAASVIDLMGNEVPQETEQGVALLSLAPMPATLKLKGASRVEPAGRLLEAAASGAAAPGRSFRVACRLFNPFDREREFRLKLENLPEEFRVSGNARHLTVPPNRTETVEFELSALPGFKPEYGHTCQLRLAYELHGTPWRGSLDIPVNSAVVIPARADFDRAPDFRLRDISQVVSLTAADPALAHRLWRGPDDLSAELFLKLDGGELRIRALVTDDRHVQPFTGFSVWKGDNIQLAFQLPGQRGCWELGLSRLDTGRSEVFLYQAPDGFAPEAAQEMKLVTTRKENVTGYELAIPLKTVALTPAAARQGFRFNLLINDNDGEGRDGWIHIAPGIGENKNPERFPFILFEQEVGNFAAAPPRNP
ncbi:hypothetical protein [Victivallis vadensis]|uniref:hypothetical protein n=1 Tax=Victivallis vadensis TaxID=172901 RepID=UPI00307E6D3E